jgi:signal transduction histidine kinase
LQQVLTFAELEPDITNIAVVDVSGRELFSQNGQPVNVTATDTANFNPVFQFSGGRISRIIYPYVDDLGRHQYSMVYDVSSARLTRSLRTAVILISALSLAVLLAAIGISYILIKQIFLDPLEQVVHSALLVQAGQFDVQISLDSRDEIGDLAAAVNHMAETLKTDITKLQELDRLKTEFMILISHNLRTPLTIINGYAETLGLEKLPAKAGGYIQSIATAGRRLLKMSEDIITIASLESGDARISLAATPLPEFLRPILDEFQSLAAGRQIKFAARLEPGLPAVELNEINLRNALWNLLDNALKFNHTQGAIDFTAARRGSRIELAISDTGAGIDPQELPKLFTKFHRGTDVLEYNYEGTGIGLYLAKLIIDRHHGTIGIESQLGRGTTVTVSLPAADPHELPAERSEARGTLHSDS